LVLLSQALSPYWRRAFPARRLLLRRPSSEQLQRLPSVGAAPMPSSRPFAWSSRRTQGPKVRSTLCWREMDSNFWYRGTKVVDFRSIPGMAGIDGAPKRYHLMVQRYFFCDPRRVGGQQVAPAACYDQVLALLAGYPPPLSKRCRKKGALWGR